MKSIDLTDTELERLIYAMEGAAGDPGLASKLLKARVAREEKALVDQGWLDVAGDAIRTGDFKRAVALLFEHAPEAMPYVSRLEDLARHVTEYANRKHAYEKTNFAKDEDDVMRAAYRARDAQWLIVCDRIDKVIEFRGAAPHNVLITESEQHVRAMALATAVEEFIAQARIDSVPMLTHDLAETWREMVMRLVKYRALMRSTNTVEKAEGL